MTSTPGPRSHGAALLRIVREQARIEADAARAKIQAVVAWAALNPGPGEEQLPPGQLYADHEVLLAGPGAPGVGQFALVDLAVELGKTPAAAKRYLGDALELGHRLPATWARIVAGELEEWKARCLAQRTKQLCAPAAAWVDTQVAPVAHKIGLRHIDRIVAEAITRFDPDQLIEAALGPTYVRITPASGPDGLHGLADLAHLEATLTLSDALALEQAVATTAHQLCTEFPDHTLDERRALALGRLADHTVGGEGPSAESGRGAAARALSLVVHLDQAALKDAALARVHTAKGLQHLVTVESVAAWCVQPGTKVTIRPVIDLATPISCPGYVPSPALREQVHMLSPTCCFPHCTIPAERCDDDHITAYADGGATDTWNLAPLCRLHHRVKTFGGWSYHQPRLGVYGWTSPTGHHYQRDRHGTTHLSSDSDPPSPG